MAGKHRGTYYSGHWAEENRGMYAAIYEGNKMRGRHRKEGEAN